MVQVQEGDFQDILDEVQRILEEQTKILKILADFYKERVIFYIVRNAPYIESLRIRDVDFLQQTAINKVIEEEEGKAEEEKAEDNRKLEVRHLISSIVVESVNGGFQVGFPHLKFYPGTKIPLDELFKVLDIGFLSRRIKGLGISFYAERDTDLFAEELMKKLEGENF
jgi:hypothetical protein